MGDEGSLPLVTMLGVNIVVAPSDVEFGEDFGTLKFIY